MTINTTLDSFLYANTVGFTPDYGKITPRQSGSLISREINQNMEKLISIGHSIVITENSETTTIEYNASFVVKTEDATLKLGTAFQGCQVTIVFAENGYIEYTKAEGNTKEKYKKNTIKKITYNGLYWIDTTPLQIPETNLTCDTAAEEEFKIVKIETILQQGKIPNNIELNIDFTNANSFGETTAATPTYPKLKITNAADEELGIYTICDSRGHYAGKGCWNSGDTMSFKIKGTKACITNSDVRETTSDYTIYSDGRKGITIKDEQTSLQTTWSSSKIVSKIESSTKIKYTSIIAPKATIDTGLSLAQKESHFYGRLLQLDGHEGAGATSYSLLLFVKANYNQPSKVVCKQLAGLYEDYDINYTRFFELGLSATDTLTITNKSNVTASFRFI
nr:MAG TPA: hypothetical protein [Caudoviricetes sp.]